MNKIKITIISLMIILFVSGAVSTVQCKAASGEKFAAIYNVKKKPFGAKSGKDSTEAIQKALDKAAKKGKVSKRAKVYVPAGTYYLSKTLSIDSNVYLQCDKKAKFIKKPKKGKRVLYMLRSAKHGKKGFNNVKNITVEGGTWDAKFIKFNKETGGSLFFFAHGQKLEFLNVTLKNNYGTHLLELGGDKDVTITGCTFSGFKKSSTDADKEALQIDVCHNYEVLPDAAPYDDTACQNIVIDNNEFYNYPRAIGSHTYVNDIYSMDIIIRNNNIHNISENAIYAYNYRNLTVEANTIKNVFAGVVFKTRAIEAPETIHKRNKGVKAMPFSDKNYNLKITGNDITTTNKSPAEYNTQLGIFVFGTPEYPINGASICDNKIKSASSGMYLRYINNSTVDGNSVTRQNNKSAGTFLVDAFKFLTCSNCTISGNEVNNAGGNLYENGFAFREGCINDTLNNNVIHEVGKHGVGVYNASTINLEGNTINNADQHGVAIVDGSSASITGNSISQPAEHGILIINGSSALINKNTISAAPKNGILVIDKSNATITGNTITGAGQHGIVVMNTSTAAINGCTIKANAGNGITISGASSDSISDNIIDDNGGTGLSIQNASSVKLINANSLNANNGKAIAINNSSATQVTNNVMLSKSCDFELTAVSSTTTVESFRTITADDISSASTMVSGACQSNMKVYAMINSVKFEGVINNRIYSIKIPAQTTGTVVNIYQEDVSGNKVHVSKTVQ